MDIVGYTDRISAAPGDVVQLMLSARAPEADVALVRLLHGDPRGPGLKLEEVPSSLAGRYPTRYQPLRAGSHVLVPSDIDLDRGFSVAVWVMPTLLDAGVQGLIGKRDASGHGWSLDLVDDGRVRLTVVADDGGLAEIVGDARLRDRAWHFVGASFDGPTGELRLQVRAQPDWAGSLHAELGTRLDSTALGSVHAAAPTAAPLLIGGSWRQEDGELFVAQTFNGKIAAPRLFDRALSADELAAEGERAGVEGCAKAEGIVAAWDLSVGTDSRQVLDVSGNDRHGRAVQMPTRAVTGPRWRGQVADFHAAPGLYDAVHLHDDDLDDAGWQPTHAWTVDDLPSGIYAARVRDLNGAEDLVPIVVRPPRRRATAPILFVAPLVSWLAYANGHATEDVVAALGLERHFPLQPEERYIEQHRLRSLYSCHSDGSGVCYASWLRPLLTMRPTHVDPWFGHAHQLSADLHLIDWLHEQGHRVDMVTDADVHHEGSELLQRYQVVLSGTHVEYWTGAMLDALQGYLGRGGRYMYLSGNGLYNVTGLDPEEGHTIEIRRYGACHGPWYSDPGEGCLSTTGESGGPWRWRGRPPQALIGVGYGAAHRTYATGQGRPYRRQPASHDPRASFVFDGIDGELIGDAPNLVHRHGAAGYELDRADPHLGTPDHALILATACDFDDENWMPAVEETVHPDVRADMVFFETPDGGAVFSTGSISWCGALSHNGYDNDVSRITGNVLRRFISPEPFELPA